MSFTWIKIQRADLVDQAVFGISLAVKNIAVIHAAIDVNGRFAMEDCLKVSSRQYFFFSNKTPEVAIGAYDAFTDRTSISTIGHRVWNCLAEQIKAV